MKEIYQMLALAMAVGVTGTAQAATRPPVEETSPRDAATAGESAKAPPIRERVAVEKAEPVKTVSLGIAVAADKLNTERGKADTANYQARLDGVVSGNSASNVATGANSIDTGSFANMAGLPVVIQNSGANVLIQNSTVINVHFR